MGGLYDFAQESIEGGLPERAYSWDEVEEEEEETPDSAFSFAASAAAVLASVAVVAF